jgi:adenine-specific DNA-methyltransferase
VRIIMGKRKVSAASKGQKIVETFRHDDATRRNIPTAEYQSVVQPDTASPVRVAYERRNRDLDPQFLWRGKDEQDWSDLVVHAPPLYIQEKIHPKALVDDLVRQTRESKHVAGELHEDLFSDFNGFPKGADKTEFYRHVQNWSNRMILGDSLQVMASLAEREGLRGKVQCIYIDPPYGIKFNSNFQWSTTSRTVVDGKADHITREPEQVRAFRDTWRDGVHSYLTYLRDRLTVARDLLTESGSIFVQIGDENVHRVRGVLDEVFGERNFISLVTYSKTTGAGSGAGGTTVLASVSDYILWYARDAERVKYRQLFKGKVFGEEGATKYDQVQEKDGSRRPLTKAEREGQEAVQGRVFTLGDLTSQTGVDKTRFDLAVEGRVFRPHPQVWKTGEMGMPRLLKARRVVPIKSSVRYQRFLDDFAAFPLTNVWLDIGGVQSRSDPKVYVVQTSTSAVERCLLMATDPGDLVLDPTCGSGTTATVAEQWGRRWITIDTSRVALALARARIMGARYPFFVLADSREGQIKEAELTHTAPSPQATCGNVRHGFVYERVPHITLKSIANNSEIDVIWDKWQATLEPLREQLNGALSTRWEEWEIARAADPKWPSSARMLHAAWWEARISRQREIDASIAAKAEFEYLYDRPYQDNKKVRVAGPFTVESLSPHRVLGVDENDELIDRVAESDVDYGGAQSFSHMILENLRVAGVQQAHKADRITFAALSPWPGEMVHAEGRYVEGDGVEAVERRAAILVGPEFGTVTRPDLVAAAREAGDAGFDVLIACAFNFDAHASEFGKLGRIPILKARMNADLHMAEDLKNTGKGNLFVVFGEPDITLLSEPDGRLRVKVNGVDVFDPSTGEVRSDGPDGIACWFIDTDYNEESFYVRHAYFLGANDPYGALKTTLKAEINLEGWASLHSDTSRPFLHPSSGRIAVKVINHLGDEVMKVFRVASGETI